MAYATQAQLQYAAGGPERFTELADWNADSVADADVIAEAQARAAGWIDSYLRPRFATPIANPSDTLIRIAADEAVYWMRSSRGLIAIDQHDIDKRKERERQLEAMRDGKLRPDEPTPARSTAMVSGIVTNDSQTSREAMKGSVW